MYVFPEHLPSLAFDGQDALVFHGVDKWSISNLGPLLVFSPSTEDSEPRPKRT